MFGTQNVKSAHSKAQHSAAQHSTAQHHSAALLLGSVLCITHGVRPRHSAPADDLPAFAEPQLACPQVSSHTQLPGKRVSDLPSPANDTCCQVSVWVQLIPAWFAACAKPSPRHHTANAHADTAQHSTAQHMMRNTGQSSTHDEHIATVFSTANDQHNATQHSTVQCNACK